MGEVEGGAPASVSVIVAAQRSGAILARQLDALSGQVDAPPFTVVVVLDHSDPGLALVASYHDRLRLVIVEVPMLGAAAARNAGARAGVEPVLLFCDADDVVGPGWVAAMSAEVRHSGLCGSPMRVEWDACPRWARPFYASVDSSSVQAFYGAEPYVVSAALGVDRARFEGVGGFDERFLGAGGEEVDLCLRIRRVDGVDAPIASATDESATVVYRPRSTFRTIARQRVGYARGTALLVTKHRLVEVGTVASIDRTFAFRMARSPRRLVILAWSFLVLRREMRRRRRSGLGGPGPDGQGRRMPPPSTDTD